MARKQRKRTNSNVPAKGRLRDMADMLWSLAVRSDWDNKCAVCGAGKVEAHHLIPRQHEATRYDLSNGIALCAFHHQFDAVCSPHQNGFGWRQWLAEHFPKVAEWAEQNAYPKFDGTKNPAHYIEVILSLKEYVEPEDFTRIVGVRFEAYLNKTCDLRIKSV